MTRPTVSPCLGLLAITVGSVASAQSPGFWEPRSALKFARQELAATVLNGLVYAGGGLGANRAPLKSFERFDPKTNTWTTIADLPTVLHHFGMAALGGKIYVIGGYGSSFTGTDKCWAFDPVTGKWSAIANLPRPRGALSVTTLGGKIHAVGGVVPRVGTVGDLTVYDPKTNTWKTLPAMPQAREHLAAVALGGKLYAVGGRRGGNFALLECYDPSSNTWKRLRSMPTARGGNGAAVLDGKIIVMGGENPGIFPQTEEYDPKTDTWRSLERMRTGVHGIYAVTIGDEILVAGGATIAGFGAVKIVQSCKLYPDGVSTFGSGTAACRGNLRVWVSHRPIKGESRFSFLSSNLPANTQGFLAIGTTGDVTGSTTLGFRTHLDLSKPIVLLSTSSTAAGTNTFRLPIPSTATGTGFTQFLWANTAACGGVGTVSSSHGSSIRLR